MDLEQCTQLAEQLMEEHKLFNWKFGFDRAKLRCGYCTHSKKTITLSEYYVTLNEESAIRNTILHEIAHALVGANHGHDRLWKQKAKSIGCTAERCNTNVVMPKGKYTAKCNTCGYTTTFYRKRKRDYGCAKCCNQYNHGKYSHRYKMVVQYG